MTTLKQRLIPYLMNHPRQVSGQELADHFKVSRNAVWKAMNELKASGYVIRSDNKMGYQIVELSHHLDAGQIQARLPEDWADLPIYVEDRVTSTNDLAKQFTIQHPGQDALFVASHQTAGRGRRGRTFYSDLTEGLYFSLVVHPRFEDLDQITLYTILAATALCQALESETHRPIKIKWVNDLFLDQRKISGILCEAVTDLETRSISSIVIGIGLNLAGDFSQADSNTQQVAGTLFPEGLPASFNPNHVLSRFLTYFRDYHRKFKEKSFLLPYQNRIMGVGREVFYREEGVTKSGIIRGITGEGHLLLEDDQGSMRPLFANEVHFSSHQFTQF